MLRFGNIHLNGAGKLTFRGKMQWWLPVNNFAQTIAVCAADSTICTLPMKEYFLPSFQVFEKADELFETMSSSFAKYNCLLRCTSLTQWKFAEGLHIAHPRKAVLTGSITTGKCTFFTTAQRSQPGSEINRRFQCIVLSEMLTRKLDHGFIKQVHIVFVLPGTLALEMNDGR